MEKQPDSAISDQDAAGAPNDAPDAGLDAGGQEAGRLNGLMSTLGKRTAERDDAIAERDRLRDELAAYQAGVPAVEPPGAAPEVAQLRDADDELEEAAVPLEQPEAPASEPEPEPYILPAGSVVRTPDGSEYLVGSASPGFIAPTSPTRSPAVPTNELEQARQRFAAELPTIVAEIQDRALLRGN